MACLPADVLHDLVLTLTRYVVACGTGGSTGERGQYGQAVQSVGLHPADVLHDLVLARTRHVVACGTRQSRGGGEYRRAVQGGSKAGSTVSGASASAFLYDHVLALTRFVMACGTGQQGREYRTGRQYGQWGSCQRI